MVERIRTLLEFRRLTPTQFADSIGIARPIVSHILSGRNKPSLEVVQRILAAMPDLSMPWLLNGTGPMLAGALAGSVAPVPAVSVPAVSVPPQGQQDSADAAVVPAVAAAPQNRVRRPPPAPNPVRTAPTASAAAAPEPKRFAPRPLREPLPAAVQVETRPQAAVEAPAVSFAAPAGVAAPPVAAAPPPVSVASVASTAATPTATALLARTEKPIRRIVIFYHDGSFADYRPE